jgi:hypothetical protein
MTSKLVKFHGAIYRLVERQASTRGRVISRLYLGEENKLVFEFEPEQEQFLKAFRDKPGTEHFGLVDRSVRGLVGVTKQEATELAKEVAALLKAQKLDDAATKAAQSLIKTLEQVTQYKHVPVAAEDDDILRSLQPRQ